MRTLRIESRWKQKQHNARLYRRGFCHTTRSKWSTRHGCVPHDVDMLTEYPADAADAPILDALNTLQSAQLGLASYSSLARFFLDEIDTELEEGTFLLEERPVGLANFASSRL